MRYTTHRTRRQRPARHLGGPRLLLAGVLLVLSAAGPRGLAALQDGSQAWRAHFAAGNEAREAGDVEAYAREMALAARGLEAGALNRPFVQYHAARAHALLARPGEAVEWLKRMWEEEIEALMLTFAVHDPAFDGMREHTAFRAVLARPGSMEVGTRALGGSVHLLSGAGANVLASVGADGVLLVDTGYGPALPAVRAALDRLREAAGMREGTGAPDGGSGVDVVILTHPHEDHWGAAAGVGREARVLAHPGTAEAMDEPLVFMEGVEVPPRPARARPDRVVTDTAFAFNGEEVRIRAFPSHTGADLAVHFPGSGVLALGDVWLAQNPMMFPGADAPDALLDGLEAFLRSLPAGTVVVGGHDPPTDPAAVLEQMAVTRATMAAVREALAEGLELEETVARLEEEFPAPWVAYFHRSLSGEG